MSILAALRTGVTTFSEVGTEAVGRALGREMGGGQTLALYGDLGVGKTTLVRGIAEALGYKDITSPSFNYYFLYQAPSRRSLLHLDAYRLAREQDYPSLMLEELLTPDSLFVVEWPERLGEYLPADALKLEIKSSGDCRSLKLV